MSEGPVMKDTPQAPPGPPPTPPLLHEMMRSFVVLAETLNLSHAVMQLESTRQTVRRHINQLEERMGVSLFTVQDRRYQLTDEGQAALQPALSIIAQSTGWLNGQLSRTEGMERLSYEDDSGWMFHQQQLSIDRIWDGRSKLLKAAVRAWSQAAGALEADAFAEVRPYIIVFRDSANGWICVELGEKSFYANWYGWATARSSIGRALNQFPGGVEIGRLTNVPFQQTQETKGIRLDQVLTKMSQTPGGEQRFAVFDRLMLGMRLPDGSPAVASVVDRAYKLEIPGIDPALLEQMPPGAGPEYFA
jgi:hypothetical protein